MKQAPATVAETTAPTAKIILIAQTTPAHPETSFAWIVKPIQRQGPEKENSAL
jgi:hypothetical protein